MSQKKFPGGVALLKSLSCWPCISWRLPGGRALGLRCLCSVYLRDPWRPWSAESEGARRLRGGSQVTTKIWGSEKFRVQLTCARLNTSSTLSPSQPSF